MASKKPVSREQSAIDKHVNEAMKAAKAMPDMTIDEAIIVTNDAATNTKPGDSKYPYTANMKKAYPLIDKSISAYTDKDARTPTGKRIVWSIPSELPVDGDLTDEQFAPFRKGKKKPAKVKEGWALTSDLQRDIQSEMREAMLREASEDDHPYGPWFGGKASQGGHAGGGTTEGKFTDKKGNYAAERVNGVHKPYVDSVMDGVVMQDGPQVIYMTGGGPASGKTSGILENPECGIPRTKDPDTDKLIPGRKAAYVNADDAKAAIPEYQAGTKNGYMGAANYAHEESSHMSKVATRVALESGHSTVIDTVGDNGSDKLHAKVAKLREQAPGAPIHANYATIPLSVAHARNEARAQRTGRRVKDEVVNAGYTQMAETVQGAVAKGTFDSIKLWNTEAKGGPRLIMSHEKGGKMKVHNQALWDRFLISGEI